MADVFDYIEWRGDLSFAQAPFNEVDALILCRLAYCPMEGVVPNTFKKSIKLGVAAKAMLADAGERRFLLEQDVRLLCALQTSPRFASMTLCGFVNHIDIAQEKQFCAVCVGVAGGIFVAFRGTDSTLVGWKEDFNMSFCLVPSALEAVQYLMRAARKRGSIMVGGHSKGGHLAVYASAFCQSHVRQRISTIYNFDGPGFIQSVMESPNYKEIVGRVQKYVPQSSIIGRLLQQDAACNTIHSHEKGLRQHVIYSWEIVRDQIMPDTSVQQSFLSRSFNDWIAAMDIPTRKRFFDACYELLSQTDAATLTDLFHKKSVLKVIKGYRGSDPAARSLILHGFVLLTRATRGNVPQPVKFIGDRKKNSGA